MVKRTKQHHSHPPRHSGNLNVDAPRNYGWKLNRRNYAAAALSEARERNSSPPTPLLQLMKYEIPVVLVLLTLKYQGKTETIFQENPAAVWCFFATTLAYWLTVGAIKEMTITPISREWIQTLWRAALASAILSAISLLCIFLPYPLSLVPLSVLITSPLSFVLLYAFSLFIEWAVKKIHGVFVWARRACNVSMVEVVCLQV